MCRAFLCSDYYDPPALRASLQPQLAQSSDRDTKFPRSQDALLQSGLGSRYIPMGDRSYVFVLSSFRSSRPRRWCMAYTPIARGIRTNYVCFSLLTSLSRNYPSSPSHIAALRWLVLLRFPTRIQHCTTSA
jgi:hypothetical protein